MPIYIYLYRFPFRRGGWALGVYLFAHPRFHAYIYLACCPRCFALLLARAIFVCCAPPLLPPFSHPPNPLVQVLHYEGISLPRLWQDIPSCASNGVWFFGGVCFRLRAILYFCRRQWSSVVGVRVWSAVVRAWFGRRAWIPRRAIRYVRGNAVMHCRVHALVRPLIFVCQVNELPEIEGGGGQCYLPH